MRGEQKVKKRDWCVGSFFFIVNGPKNQMSKEPFAMYKENRELFDVLLLEEKLNLMICGLWNLV